MPSEVRFFFVRIIQISFFTATIVGVVFFSIQPDPDSYIAESLQQIKLLEKTKGPRIILAGGSNVAFGFDAELMQKELGIPVINDGLHAGLGIIPLKELLEYIHKGDVIIISLEYSMFSSKDIMDGDSGLLSDWIEDSPSRVKYLSNPLVEVPSIYTIMLQQKVNRSLEYVLNGGSLDKSRNIYNSNNFDVNGDFIGHLHLPSLRQDKIPPGPYPVQHLQDDIFIFLENYDLMVHAKGSSLYFEAPASRQGNCDVTGEKKLRGFFNTFNKRLDIPILTPLHKVCMPNKYFFDTPYHLNAEGRRVKTQRLIEDLIGIINRDN